MKTIFRITAIALLSSVSLMAQDRVFNYTYQSNVLNKGVKEIEVWTSVNTGKNDYYRQLENRVEYEVGLGSNLQMSFYLNSKQNAFYDDITGEIVMEPTEISFSNEWKYKFSDPVANKIGFAGYAEITVATDELELELKAIFDKKIGNTLHALNLVVEEEWETTTVDGKMKTNQATKYDFNYGASYMLSNKWNLGAEFLERNVYYNEDHATHSAIFAGPCLEYHVDSFWINLSYSPQIVGLHNPDGSKGLNVDEFTKNNFRVLFSYWFK
ncbi:hypothetical protein [Flavobacterium sp.]|uniref:hypothetical protein n=1 Tax=Flavobacterium sp. TaxID=239 RepID=UPI002FD8B534